MPQRTFNSRTNLHRRLNEFKADLGISESQNTAWENFAKTCSAVAIALEGFEAEAAGCCREHLPTFPNALELEIRTLTARLAALRMVKAITRTLYSVLGSRQRERANRLLPALSGEIVGRGWSAHLQSVGRPHASALDKPGAGRQAGIAA